MHPRRSQRTGNANNFKKAEKVQIFFDNAWIDYTKPCGSSQVIEMALKAEQLYGMPNVRIVKI